METTDIINDPRARRWAAAARWLLLFPLGFVIAPYIFTALFGLAGLLLGVLGMVATWMLRPWVTSVAANLRLKLIKVEAAKNPVETLQAEHLRNAGILEDRKEGIEAMGSAVRTLDQAIDSLQNEFPDSPELPQMREDQAELMGLLQSRSEEWQAAYVTHGEFAKEIKRVGKLWEVSLAAAKARQQSGLTEDEWTAKLKTQTAIDSIRSSLNTQLSSLTTERMQADAERILRGRSVKQAIPDGQATTVNPTSAVRSKPKLKA